MPKSTFYSKPLTKVIKIYVAFLLAFAPFGVELIAQGISGYVQDEDNNPIPFANIYIRQLSTGTATDANGRYYINLASGIYDVIYSSVGYKSASIEVVVGDEMVQHNMWLKTSDTELNVVVISSKRRDPAYEIIQKVIKNKKRHLAQLSSSKSQVYIKATELVDVKKRKKEKPVIVSLGGAPVDPFEAGEENKGPEINMLEMQLTLNYQYPGRYKEERSAVKVYGSKEGLYIPQFDETDFNFYNNLVELKGLAEAPVISPISRTSILSYKFMLEDVDTIDTNIVYKIKVTPRKTGNSTCRGYLYINDSLWNINKLDLSFHKGGLKFYDQFRLKQSYGAANDTLWIPIRQEFIYETKQGRFKTFKGNTILNYSDFQINYPFPDKFFGNEIAITKKEAYKKDSSYWNSSRPEPLTQGQKIMVHHRDSIEAVHNSTKYKDSIETSFNKITLGEAFLYDVGFRAYQKKRQLSFSSVLNTTGFEIIGGLRFYPYMWYFKRWESGRYISTRNAISIGYKNGDVQGSSDVRFLYDPMRSGTLDVYAGRRFYSINPNDAYLNQLRRSNYILVDQFGANNRIELFNGFYSTVGFNYAYRQSVSSLNSETFIGDLINDREPLTFANYTAFTTTAALSYTPKQRFITEPDRKVVLGSAYPTFNLNYKKGWSGLFSSDIDFDLLEFEVRQKLVVGVLGNSEYSLQTGKFLNTNDLRIIDVKRFRESDPYLYSDPLTSFQLLDTSLIATKPYFEGHFIHHFNGALVNNIPLIKKLRIRVVAGAGILWVKESNYRYEEIFAGFERVFKLGARRRLRIGLYGVAAQSNRTKPNTDFKISFDIIDIWKRDWSY